MKNTNVISPSDTKEHIIDGYHFKVMSEFASMQEQKNQKEEQAKQANSNNDETQNEAQENEQESTPNSSAQRIVELLKEKEEIIDKAARAETQLEMKLENQQKEFEAKLELSKKDAEQAGYERAKAESERELGELRDKFAKSIARLDETSQNLAEFISKNEKELANAAIEIAQDVISQELSERSAQIALNLAQKLIAELKGAASMELKISPSDYDFVKSKLALNSKVKVSLDDAISKGSVVVLSDKGNIESDLNSRLNKIKQMASE